MNILVTGSAGFIGKNLCLRLENENHTVFKYDKDNSFEDLEKFVFQSDFIFHLAGVMRPKNSDEFYSGNTDLTSRLCELIKVTKSQTSIIFTSSIQSELNNDYGISKLQAENKLYCLGKENGNKIFIYRLTNAFGKWSKPNYNSVVSTFCYNISHNLPITISDREHIVNFIYIDDIVNTFLDIVDGKIRPLETTFNSIEPFYPVSLGELADLIYSFKETRNNFFVPAEKNEFAKKLYATYLSYLDEDDFKYPLVAHEDNRGAFLEFLKTENSGQIGINIAHPGITKGNHYHNTKNEKFLVVSGTCSIKFRKVGSDKITEYIVSGDKLEVVDIPTGYTHSITNIGTTDSVTIMWANEKFDPNSPDTFFENVIV